MSQSPAFSFVVFLFSISHFLVVSQWPPWLLRCNRLVFLCCRSYAHKFSLWRTAVRLHRGLSSGFISQFASAHLDRSSSDIYKKGIMYCREVFGIQILDLGSILCPSNLSIWLWAEWSLRHNVHYNVLPSLHAVPYTGNLAVSITFKPFTCHSGFHLCLFESSFIIINNNSKEKEGMEKEGGARGRRAGRRHLS